ncbi:MAG: hydrogenase [Kiritimatiellae bacterium]|nr:hydrogenase [Kiritimatiellia bacterium]
MITLSEIALALFLVSDLVLAGASRLKSAVRFVAMQGVVVGVLPVLMWNWADEGCPGARVWIIAFVNTLVKGVALPMLLMYAVRKARTRRELEPIVSFHVSQLIVFFVAIGAFAVGRLLHVHASSASELAVPVALTTMGTGLLLICGRKKAITQVLGFLILENGISVFGAAILLEYGIVVELGILLDVFALVFILGIAVFQISRTFSSTDTDKLNHLGDTHLMHPHHQHDHVHA